MPGITYFVALPFDVADGSVVVGEPIECPSPARPIAEIRAFKLIVSKLRSSKHDVNRIITDPTRFKFEKLNAYSFLLGGFRVLAILDGQELGSEFDELIINRTNVFRGAYLNFEALPEFKRLVELFAASDKPVTKPTLAAR
jgi:hypothetical protein